MDLDGDKNQEQPAGENLTAEIARRVLAAELVNMIRKVSEGGTLSAADRLIFQKAAFLPTFASPKRAELLLKRWDEAGKLTADELAELQSIFATPPPPPPAPDPAPLETPADFSPPPPPRITAPAPDLVLEDAPRVANGRVYYSKPLRAYAETYDVDEKTVKRWINRGKDAAPEDPTRWDLPPLHRPQDLPAWFARRHDGRAVPDKILAVAAMFAKPPQPSEPGTLGTPAPAPLENPASAPDAAAQETPRPLRDFSEIKTLDLAGNVEQLRRTLAINKQLLDEAQGGRDEALIASRQRNYERTYDLLRKSETDLVEYQKARGELVPKTDVRRENNRIAAAVATAVRRLVKSVRPRLVGKSDNEQDAVWKEETERLFVAFKSAAFTDPRATDPDPAQ